MPIFLSTAGTKNGNKTVVRRRTSSRPESCRRSTTQVVLGTGRCPLKSPKASGLRYHRGRSPHVRRSAMNAFIAHHQPAIRFDYSCFDRILLNGVIQVLQSPACVVGFLKEKRQADRVTPAYFRDISTDYHYF